MRIIAKECRRRGSTTKTVVIILAVVGTLGFFGIFFCAGLVYFAFNAFKTMGTDFPAAQAASDSFLEDLKSNQIEAAYAKTTVAFQSGQTLEQFRAFVDRFSTFKTQTSKTSSGVRVFQGPNRKQATIKMTLSTRDNAMSCTLVLVHDDGQWLVEQLTVP